MPDTFDPNALDEFKQGIREHDSLRVEAALKKGIKASTDVDGKHPLIALLSVGYKDLPPEARDRVKEDQFRQSTRDIVSRLLDSGAKVAEEETFKTPFLPYLADRFLITGDKEIVADIVIHAISETLKDGRPVYQPNLPNFIANYLVHQAGEKADYKAIASDIMNMIEGVYDAVRGKLENPKTDAEREVAAAGDKVAPWRSPMQRPGIDEILRQVGLSAAGVTRNAPEAAEDFEQVANPRGIPIASFLTTVEKKEPSAVLLDLKAQLVGHADLQRELKQLVFRQNFEVNRKVQGLPEAEPENYSTAYIGNDGVGKGILARKQVELLVALGLVGDKNFSITEENLGAISGGTTPQSLAKIFAAADTIIVELPPSPHAPGPNTPDLGKTFMLALQMSLLERKVLKKPDPIVFLTGRRDDIEDVFEQVAALKTIVPNLRTMADLTDSELGEVLNRKLKKTGYELDDDGKKLVVEELVKARKSFGGNDFRHAKEVDAIVKKLPSAMAERLSQDAEENEGALIAPLGKEALTHATVADIKAINIPRIVGGLGHARRSRPGF
ncbi:MAG: hypothetical protein ACAH80_03780 [Alphaproteobacteria bacterium]